MNFELWKHPIHFLAYGFGTGLAPYAPGTFGSMVGVGLFLLMAPLPPLSYAAGVLVLFILGIYICGSTARDFGATDPGFIVYDEIVGFLVAMYMMPADWRWIAAGFVLYRTFDIWKPFPIGWIEDKVGLGLGIMADDLIAGLYTLIILQATRLLIERLA